MGADTTASGPGSPGPEGVSPSYAASAPPRADSSSAEVPAIVDADIDPAIDLTAVLRMLRDDLASATLGMKVTELHLGRATVTMPVTESMLQGHNTCHGGYIMTVADTAFAAACNSHGPVTVAAAVQITYVAPAYGGDLLTATAVEVSRWGRNGLYDVEVRNDKGVVALFRGTSRTIERSAREREGRTGTAERS